MIFSLFKPLSDRQYQRWETIGAAVGIACLAWLLISRFTSFNHGVLSAFAGTFMMASVGCYRTRQTERGVWMLALLIGIGLAAFQLLATIMHVRDTLRGARSPVPITLDTAIATFLTLWTCRATWTVVKQNYAMSKALKVSANTTRHE